MLELPEKLFKREFEEFEIGGNCFKFFSKDICETSQIECKNDNNKVESQNGFGKEYIVIGKNVNSGNSIIAKVDETEIPVFTMYNNGIASIDKVAESFEQYMGVLSMIKGTDLYRKDKVIDLLDEIEEIVPHESLYYWEDLINSAYNYLTD